MVNMSKRFTDFIESFVIFVIILVLFQTFFEDLATVINLDWKVRKILVVSGFIFDLFFTIEFLTRFYIALVNKRAKDYFFYERGWIDFIASMPLLMFNSGPGLLALIAGVSIKGVGGVLNILKVVKAVRIARILRLLRVLKIFKQIKYADSKMAQRHVSTIIGLAVTTFVFTLFATNVAFSVFPVEGLNESASEKQAVVAEYLSTSLLDGYDDELKLEKYAESSRDLLKVTQGDTLLYSRFEDSYYDNYEFGPNDYFYFKNGEYEFFFDQRADNRQQAVTNITFFAVILILVLVFLFYYSPHFAITVSDPILIMRKGMSDKGYNLEVKVSPRYRDDDVFLLAKEFNEVYLPMKDRVGGEEVGAGTDLKLEDFGDIFDVENSDMDFGDEEE